MDRFDLHGSTFAGNALSCALASETLAVIEDERAAERGAEMLALLRERLAGHPLQVRRAVEDVVSTFDDYRT